MAHRTVLTARQRAALFDLATDQASLLKQALLHGSDNSRKPPLPVIQAMRFV